MKTQATHPTKINHFSIHTLYKSRILFLYFIFIVTSTVLRSLFGSALFRRVFNKRKKGSSLRYAYNIRVPLFFPFFFSLNCITESAAQFDLKNSTGKLQTWPGKFEPPLIEEAKEVRLNVRPGPQEGWPPFKPQAPIKP